MRIKIDNTVYEIAHVYKYESDNCAVIRCSNQEFMLFRNASEAGTAVAEYYDDLRRNDPAEFRCLIGDERLIQWACAESDSFGISSFEEFKERVAEVPEEHWASYDGRECDVQRVGWLVERIGFKPTVAYRSN